MAGRTVPTLPKGPEHKAPVIHQTGTTKTDKPGGTGSGGKGKNPYAQAQAAANAAQKKQDRKEADKYIRDARGLAYQIRASRVALGPKGFERALNIKLAGLDLLQGQADKQLMDRYADQYGDLKVQAQSNTNAAADNAYTNLANRGRERANATAEAMNLGSGESDLLQTQAMSLRSWNANQSEGNRAYYDGQNSLNSSLTDLTWDVKNARQNNAIDYNAERGKAWDTYHAGRGSALTTQSNNYGLQSTYYTAANQAVPSKKTKKQATTAQKNAADMAKQAGLETGKQYKNPGIPKELQDWQGEKDFEKKALNNSVYRQAFVDEGPVKKPSGAGLRKW